MTPTQIAVTFAVGVGPTALLVALFGLAMWLDRPARVTRQQSPAPVVPDDLTALADVLVVDPPTTRPYVVPDPDLLPGEVIVGTAKIHRGCRDLRRDGRPGEMCNHCAPLLDKVTVAPW